MTTTSRFPKLACGIAFAASILTGINAQAQHRGQMHVPPPHPRPNSGFPGSPGWHPSQQPAQVLQTLVAAQTPRCPGVNSGPRHLPPGSAARSSSTGVYNPASSGTVPSVGNYGPWNSAYNAFPDTPTQVLITSSPSRATTSSPSRATTSSPSRAMASSPSRAMASSPSRAMTRRSSRHR